MKLLALTEDSYKTLQTLSHHALKGAGIEAFNVVKSLESWISSAIDHPAQSSSDPETK